MLIPNYAATVSSTGLYGIYGRPQQLEELIDGIFAGCM